MNRYPNWLFLVLAVCLTLTLAALVLVFMAVPAHGAAYSYQLTYASNWSVVPEHESKPTVLRLKNTGTSPWLFDGPNAFHLGTDAPHDRNSGFKGDNWLALNRIRITKNFTNSANVVSVLPNEEAEFDFDFKPTGWLDGGVYQENFAPVVEGVAWLPGGLYWRVTHPAPVGAYFYTWYGPGEVRWDHTVDTADVWGRYDSAGPASVAYQLDKIEQAGFDFVLLSYWPTLPGGYTQHHYDAVNEVIGQIHANHPKLSFAFLVEPPLSGTAAIPQQFYNDVWNAYHADPQYQHSGGQMLMPAYLYRTSGGDQRFHTPQISGNATATWPDLKIFATPPEAQGGMVSVFMRFDNCQPWASGCKQYDAIADGNIWENQQKLFLNYNRATLRTVLFYGWNEYYERANIEPHHGFSPEVLTGDGMYLRIQDYLLNGWKK